MKENEKDVLDKYIDEFSKPPHEYGWNFDPEEELSVLDPELWESIGCIDLCETIYMKAHALNLVHEDQEEQFEEWLCSHQHFLNWMQTVYALNELYMGFITRSPLIIKKLDKPGYCLAAGESLS